jgi:hypothetical protein
LRGADRGIIKAWAEGDTEGRVDVAFRGAGRGGEGDGHALCLCAWTGHNWLCEEGSAVMLWEGVGCGGVHRAGFAFSEVCGYRVVHARGCGSMYM